MTTTLKSSRSKARGTPAARMSAPVICTSVVIRYGTSSVS
jgi:hypothetical protein